MFDALAARFLTAPGSLDVVVASNLFGDILSELSSAIMGSIGVAPSANVDPLGASPTMFEPVHGSAPDIAGQGIADATGQIWTDVMPLESIGLSAAACRLMAALEATLEAGDVTADLGGDLSTREMAAAVGRRLVEPKRVPRSATA